VTVTCSVLSPTDGTALSFAEPGEQLAVVVQASASVDDVDVLPRVSVFFDGHSYPATQGADGNFTAQCRLYHAGAQDITATAVAGGQKSQPAVVQVQVSLQSAVPSLTVVAPTGSSTVALAESGTDVPVTVVMADETVFGPHAVAALADGPSGVPVPLAATSATHFSGIVHLAPMPLGPRTITVTGSCPGASSPPVSATATVTVVGTDVTPPSVRVTHPAVTGGQVAAASAPAGLTVTVTGEASDPQSGMVGGLASVAVALSPDGTPVVAVPVNPGDWSAWTVTLPVPSLGTFPLYVSASDAAGNSTRLLWGFEAITSWVPSSLDERLSQFEYLRGLLQFALNNITATDPAVSPPTASPVSSVQLATVVGQRVDAISQPATAAAAAAQLPVNELRVPVEILRAQGAAQHVTPSAAGQAAYLDAAYQMLLAGLGTSYSELRVARGGAPEERRALADRIGLPLYGVSGSGGGAGVPPPARPDQLDALTLDGPPLTEQALQDLFGLTTTAPFDPDHLPTTQATPQVLSWQMEAQRNQWQSRDAAPPVPLAYTVIIDPDVITPAEVNAASPQAPRVLALLSDRAGQLAAQASMLSGRRAAAASDPDGGFAALMAAGLPAGVDIAVLHAQDAQGVDISAQLTAAGLDRAGFAYLVQLQRLAAASGPLVSTAEWTAAVDVLVGAFRRSQYAAWTAPDPATGLPPEAGIVLSPDTFVLTDSPPPAGPLRIDPAARRDWQATLRTRILQQRALTDGTTQMVTAAERAALPVLRDALLADLAGPSGNPTLIGEQISKRFQVDVLVSGALTTTRLEQAITSLQTLLLLVRSGENTPPDNTPASALFASLTLATTPAVFDASWTWIGTLSSWKSATTTFLFPEAALDPSLISATPGNASIFSAAFTTLRDALSAGPGVVVTAPVDVYTQGVLALVQNAAGQAVSFAYPTTRSADNQTQLAGLSATVRDKNPNLALEVFWVVPMLVAQRLHADGNHQAALDWLWTTFPYTDPHPISIYQVINDELVTDVAQGPDLTLLDWTAFDPFALIAGRPYPHLRATLLAIISCLLDFADSEFATETGESIAHARNLYRTAAGLLTHPRFTPVEPSDQGDAALPIPQLAVYTARAATQLGKIRQDRNIAGLPRTQAVSSGDPIRQPTPYHFKALLARAQQLAQQATSLEAEYLAALEKFDNKTLQFSDAQHVAAVAAAQKAVHDAQVQQATDALTAAQAQKAKADTMVSTYTSAINSPLNQYENALIDNFSDMRNAQGIIAGGDLAIGLGQAAAEASNVTKFGLGAIGAGLLTAGAALKFGGQIWLNEIQKSIQENQLHASIEDRHQEWRIQRAAAQQDQLVAAAQVTTADDQKAIAKAEQSVAALQADQAQATLDLLAAQFTSPGMYKWLSDTLGGVYRYFLQQATATARLAQAQLAFERAEPARAFIRSDYWQPLTVPPSGDVKGLTGAERLAEDLAKLDTYAFSTDSRRLNITQTFSLAALAPVEFLDFRATGQLSVATPTTLFDADFPGHYQRLIRQARLSVVALVPPSRGIRATLASYGISRVTTASNGVFGEVLLRRDPSVVALTSPVDANGVFTVDLQPDMLLPFEGSGVDTTWELTLLQAANPFDFRTISDVLLTIDYTALLDLDYQAQVIRQLNADRTRSADRVFSLSRDFPDQWYTLNNPDLSAQGRTATVTLRDADFPPGITGLATAQIAVRLSGSGPIAGISVTLTRGGTSGTAATDASGTASTRRGAADWTGKFVGSAPTGDWQLSFDPAASSTLFAPGGLDDIVLVVSWAGQSLPWPT
jgi:hypothetical protein